MGLITKLIVKLQSDIVYSVFNVELFEQIQNALEFIAPSMIEYYLEDLALNSTDQIHYINRTEIQDIVYFDQYKLLRDYSENIYLEFTQKETSYETESLW